MVRLALSDFPKTKVILDFSTNFTDRDTVCNLLSKLKSAPVVVAKPVEEMAPVSKEELKWRQALLSKSAVRNLHTRLVVGDVIEDATFWTGMKFRYKPNGDLRANAPKSAEGETAERAEIKGVPSDAFEGGGGEWKGDVPSAAQRHGVYLKYPFMKEAVRVLGKEMGEEKVWQMYKSSSMEGFAGRGKQGMALMSEADAVFAPFQAKFSVRRGEVDRMLDIGRFDGHELAEGERKNRNVGEGLRFMRMVNLHGGLIVEEGGERNWSDELSVARPLEDLEIGEEKSFARLGVQVVRGKEICGTAGVGMWEELKEWDADLSRFCGGVGKKGVLNALMGRMQP